MRKPSLTERKTQLPDQRGMGMMPALLLAGICSVTQIHAADEAASPLSAPPTTISVPEVQDASTVKMEADLAVALQERDKMAATLADTEQNLSTLSAQRDELTESLAAEQAARSKAEQALAGV